MRIESLSQYLQALLSINFLTAIFIVYQTLVGGSFEEGLFHWIVAINALSGLLATIRLAKYED